MAQELKIFQPAILEANPSLLARLAFWAWDEGVELYSPKAIIFTYEFPSQIHISAIKRSPGLREAPQTRCCSMRNESNFAKLKCQRKPRSGQLSLSTIQP